MEYGFHNPFENESEYILFKQIIDTPLKIQAYINRDQYGTNQKDVKIFGTEKLQKGDHIYIVLTKPVVYEHHGIYIGD